MATFEASPEVGPRSVYFCIYQDPTRSLHHSIKRRGPVVPARVEYEDIK